MDKTLSSLSSSPSSSSSENDTDQPSHWTTTNEKPSMLAILTKVAERNKHREILHIGVSQEFMGDFQFFLGDTNEDELPFALIVESQNGWKKYKLPTDDPNIKPAMSIDNDIKHQPCITFSSLLKFEEDYFNRRLSVYLRSEIPVHGGTLSVTHYPSETESSSHHVQHWKANLLKPKGQVEKLVGSQFAMDVIGTTVDSLVYFYAPWCGHCKIFDQAFLHLARRFAQVRSIDFLKIDATRNDVDHKDLIIERVPYVRLFIGGVDKNASRTIRFDHTVKDPLTYGMAFLLQNASCRYFFDHTHVGDNFKEAVVEKVGCKLVPAKAFKQNGEIVQEEVEL